MDGFLATEFGSVAVTLAVTIAAGFVTSGLARRFWPSIESASNADDFEEFVRKAAKRDDRYQYSAQVGLSFDVARFELSDRFYRQALWQSTAQFVVGLIVTVSGAIWLFASTQRIDPADATTFLQPAAGVVVEVVGGLFLTVGTALRRRATLFHSRLERRERLHQALALAETIADPAEKDRLKTEIVKKLMESD